MQVPWIGCSDFADASVGNQLKTDFSILQLRESLSSGDKDSSLAGE